MLLLVAAPATLLAQDASVTVYSFRQPFLIEPILRNFEAASGIPVNVRYDKKGLVDRIRAEGHNSPADLLLATDIGQLIYAKQSSVTQPARDPALAKAIPPQWRDPDGHWFALTLRARIVFVRAGDEASIPPSLEALGSPTLGRTICVRSGQHPYNLSLIAAHIARHGEDATREWLSGWRDNLWGRPAGNDRAQLRRLVEGACDMAVANSYYLGAMLAGKGATPEQRRVAREIRPAFVRFAEGGAHVNVSGMALARYAPHRKEALALMRWLASPSSQRAYAEFNHEFPARAGIPASELVSSWGELVPDSTPLGEVAALRERASALVDETRFDEK